MKKLFAVLLALTMVLSLVACGSKQAEVPAEEITEEVSGSYPITVTDQAGREVTLEEYPARVVSGYYISTSALIALGQADKLVGVENRADLRPVYGLSAPHLLELPGVGTVKELDLEGCLALDPDLVILPMKLKDTASTLEEMGIDVLVVYPESGELLSEMIGLLGVALDCRPAAEDLITAMDGILNETLLMTAVSSYLPSVYLAGNSSFLSTAPNGMYQSELISKAGGINAASEIEDTYWVEVSYEQVLAWDPDAIILASNATYTVEDVLADPALAECAAVKNGSVYQMPADAEAWDSPVPGGVLGALWMASKLHPEYVTEETVTA